jgi:hypothetical protein
VKATSPLTKTTVIVEHEQYRPGYYIAALLPSGAIGPVSSGAGPFLTEADAEAVRNVQGTTR